jgi:hypothetical protein
LQFKEKYGEHCIDFVTVLLDSILIVEELNKEIQKARFDGACQCTREHQGENTEMYSNDGAS